MTEMELGKSTLLVKRAGHTRVGAWAFSSVEKGQEEPARCLHAWRAARWRRDDAEGLD